MLNLEEALTELNQRIDNGEEFPEACWLSATHFSVSYKELQRAYDEQAQVNALINRHFNPLTEPLGFGDYVEINLASGLYGGRKGVIIRLTDKVYDVRLEDEDTISLCSRNSVKLLEKFTF